MEEELYELRMKILRLVIELGPVDQKIPLMELCAKLETFQYFLGEYEGQTERENGYFAGAMVELKKYAPEEVYRSCCMDD